MMDEKLSKFENPTRMAELTPKETLIKAGFKADMTLCDIGAGTGIFSFPAAQISSNAIYSMEISDNMIALLKRRAAERNVENLNVIKVDSRSLAVDHNCIDMAVMVTVLHEIDDKEFMLKEIRRILKEDGRLMIIEFHKGKTPMGPPPEHRLGQEDAEALCHQNGFHTIDHFALGDNFYCLVLGH